MKINFIKKFDIYDFLTMKIVNYLNKTIEFDEAEREKLYLGIISIIINLVKTTLICFIAYFLGILIDVMFMMLVFGCLRLTAAGLHAKSCIRCTITTLSLYISGAFLSSHYIMPKGLCIFICIILMILLYKYSPSDTDNRPILGKENRLRLKRQTLFTALIFFSLSIIIGNIKILNLTVYSMLFQVICILPITYKLLKRSYKNYEQYEK